MDTKHALICIGNATIDAFLQIHDSNKECRIEEASHDLCVRFGEKIDVDSSEFCVGGNAANVAVGLSRLGIKTGLMAEIGDDEFAHAIRQTLTNEQVELDLIKRTAGSKSSFAMGINFKGDRTLFVQHVQRNHLFDFSNLQGLDALFLTSLGHDWETPYKHVLDFLNSSSTKLLFNPGSLQLHEKKEIVQLLLTKTHILFVNKEEAELMLFGAEVTESQNSAEYIEKLMRQLQARGSKIIVLTNGIQGSYALDTGGKIYQQSIAPAPVVERTGAGDGYTAAFIASWVLGKSIEEGMEWGARNASAVVGKIGAQAGLLTKNELTATINTMPDLSKAPQVNSQTEKKQGGSFTSFLRRLFGQNIMQSPANNSIQQQPVEQQASVIQKSTQQQLVEVVGYNRDLIVLAFDHRNTFGEHLFNTPMDQLTPEQKESIKDFKNLIFESFQDALQKGVPKEKAAILVEEEYGDGVLQKARAEEITTILTTEKTGQKEFEFQYGDQFGDHIKSYQPSFAKALIRYNPNNDSESNRRQQVNLKRLNDFCHMNNFKFLLEPLVPATEEQLKSVDNSQERYDKELRAKLTVRMIKEFQDAGIEIDVWKLEGFESKEDYQQIVTQAKIGGRDHVGVVVLGRGAGEEKVEEWIKLGASVPGVIGFAVGRTIFWDAVVEYYKKTMTREQARDVISGHFQRLYLVFEEGRKNSI